MWLLPIAHGVEIWNVVQRNCVDFKRIPNDLIAKFFVHKEERNVPDEVCNCPAIDVIIPCYNEDTDMVMRVVKAALDMDYPKQLLEVHLCDDGRDNEKRRGIAKLKRVGKYHNVHYVTRPDNSFAKPGNVNNALQKTSGHLIVQFDADFIARPQLLQRLLPYFFVWNADTRLYDFNQTVSFVQTPQYYRNLSPHDTDMFDQRNVSFFTRIQQGRDWFNMTTMVGTSNLINRQAIEEAGYFPYHSKGDDIALSVLLHGHGYRSYHVTECVATGLVPPSLKGNFAQRRRWYSSDFEILFSNHGALTQKGLSLLQRYVYLGIPMFRFLNLSLFFVDVVMALVLLAGFFVVDIIQPKIFVILVTLHLTMAQLPKTIEGWIDRRVLKSIAGNELFEIVFRYSTLKGLFSSLFGARMKWKTAEKTVADTTAESDGDPEQKGNGQKNSESWVKRMSKKKKKKKRDGSEDSSEQNREVGTGSDTDATVPWKRALSANVDEVGVVSHSRVTSRAVTMTSSLSSSEYDTVIENDEDEDGDDEEEEQTVFPDANVNDDYDFDEDDIDFNDDDVAFAITDVDPDVESSTPNTAPITVTTTTTSSPSFSPSSSSSSSSSSTLNKKCTTMPIFSRRYARFVLRNLKRCWYNIFMLVVLSAVLTLSIVFPADFTRVLDDGREVRYNNVASIALSFGYLVSGLIPHVVVVLLCFKRRYVIPWEVEDVVSGRCDGYVEEKMKEKVKEEKEKKGEEGERKEMGTKETKVGETEKGAEGRTGAERENKGEETEDGKKQKQKKTDEDTNGKGKEGAAENEVAQDRNAEQGGDNDRSEDNDEGKRKVKVRVPRSAVMYLSMARTAVMVAALVYTIVKTVDDGFVEVGNVGR